MGFHLFPIVTFLMVGVVATIAGAALLPPQLYWKSMLPTTPMPRAITDLLLSDWRDVKATSVGVGNGGVNVGVEKGYNNGDSTNVNVGGGNGGVAVNSGKKGVPVHVGVGYYSPFDYNYAASETQLHDEPKMAIFFLEKDLHQGTIMNLHFIKSSYVAAATFLPRRVADSIPFQSNKMEYILSKFSVEKGSEEAEIMKNTINVCEKHGIKGEEKKCVTSLESMVDFCTSKIGKNVEVVSTEVKKEKETKLQKYTIASGVKKFRDNKNNVVVCHSQNYPYAVFYCHKTSTIEVYSVPLEGADGNRVKAIAVCHTDTSEWNPKHLAFQALKVKPGTLPICHFLPQDHVVWVQK